eukprot:gene8825-6208_t
MKRNKNKKKEKKKKRKEGRKEEEEESNGRISGTVDSFFFYADKVFEWKIRKSNESNITAIPYDYYYYYFSPAFTNYYSPRDASSRSLNIEVLCVQRVAPTSEMGGVERG